MALVPLLRRGVGFASQRCGTGHTQLRQRLSPAVEALRPTDPGGYLWDAGLFKADGQEQGLIPE